MSTCCLTHAAQTLREIAASPADETVLRNRMAGLERYLANAALGAPASSPAFRPGLLPANQKVLNYALEHLTGVEARWLGGVRPFFEELIRLAEDGEVTDAEFQSALRKASKDMPELFAKLDTAALADSLEAAMGAAMVNGAVSASLRRNIRRPKTGSAGIPAGTTIPTGSAGIPAGTAP